MLSLIRTSLVAAVLAWFGVAAFAAEPVFPGTGYPKWQPYSQTNPLVVAHIFKYGNITTDTTTTLKTGAGILHSLSFNTPVATTVVTVYDNTAGSGTKIATITVPASPQPVTMFYDVAFTTGLTIVTATAASDITVSYQ